MTVSRVTDQDFEEITGHILSSISFLKMFPILQDTEDNEMFIDIFRSYSVFDDTLSNASYFNTYACKNEDWWDNISAEIYNTPSLWWMVCLVNNIVNPFEEMESGKLIQVLSIDYVPQLVREIRSMGDL